MNSNNNSNTYDKTFSNIARLKTVEWALRNVDVSPDIKRIILEFIIGEDKYLYNHPAENVKHLKSNLFINTIFSVLPYDGSKGGDKSSKMPLTIRFFPTLRAMTVEDAAVFFEMEFRETGFEKYFKRESLYDTNKGVALVIYNENDPIDPEIAELFYTVPEKQLLPWDRTFGNAELNILNQLYNKIAVERSYSPALRDINFPKFDEYSKDDNFYSIKAVRLLFSEGIQKIVDKSAMAEQQQLRIKTLRRASQYIEKISDNDGKKFLYRFVKLIVKNHNISEFTCKND